MMTKEQEKLKYEKPTVRACEFQQRCQILAGSKLGNPGDYPNGGDPFGF